MTPFAPLMMGVCRHGPRQRFSRRAVSPPLGLRVLHESSKMAGRSAWRGADQDGPHLLCASSTHAIIVPPARAAYGADAALFFLLVLGVVEWRLCWRACCHGATNVLPCFHRIFCTRKVSIVSVPTGTETATAARSAVTSEPFDAISKNHPDLARKLAGISAELERAGVSTSAKRLALAAIQRWPRAIQCLKRLE